MNMFIPKFVGISTADFLLNLIEKLGRSKILERNDIHPTPIDDVPSFLRLALGLNLPWTSCSFASSFVHALLHWETTTTSAAPALALSAILGG